MPRDGIQRLLGTCPGVEAMSDEARMDNERAEAERANRSRLRRRRLRWASVVAVVLVVAAGAVLVLKLGPGAASGRQQDDASADGVDGSEDEDKASVPVEVVTLGVGEISSYISATANLVAEQDVTVISEAEGRVTVLEVEEGHRVSRGDVLAVLDSDEKQIAVRKAEARRENASRALERGAELFAKELLSRTDHDNLRVELEIAERELEETRWQLDRNTFRAPFSGVVTSRSIQVGQHVRPGDVLFQVTDFDRLIARIHLPETDVLRLSEGRRVHLALTADPAVRFSGRIRQISPVVDTATGTVKVTIEASDAPAGVRPGSFVAVNIVSQSRPGSVLLPKHAVVRELQAIHVFVARDGIAERRRVQLGLEEGEWFEAVDGVAEGDQVVVAGQGGLKDGAAIRILEPANDEAGG